MCNGFLSAWPLIRRKTIFIFYYDGEQKVNCEKAAVMRVISAAGS
jgi:hypothetical protein